MAKDEHRKFKHCIFCNVKMQNAKGPTQRTREHIFGKSIADYLPQTAHWNVPKNFTDNCMDPFNYREVKKGSSQITYITSRSVCYTCNNGELRQQSEFAFDQLCALIDGRQHSLSIDEQHAVFLYFCRFGMIVDVETSNLDLNLSKDLLGKYISTYGSLRNYAPTISAHTRNLLLANTAPKNIWVYIGYHDGVLGKIIEFNIAPKITTIPEKPS